MHLFNMLFSRKLPIVITGLIVVTLLAVSCEGDATKTNHSSTPVDKAAAPLPPPPGWRLLRANCTACHKPAPTEGLAVAPSLTEIREVYLQAHPDKADFVKAMVAFSKQPSLDAALMTGAVQRYGLMPKVGASEADLRVMATYLYEEEVGTEAWYDALSAAPQPAKEAADEEETYEDRGRRFAMGTKQTLGSRLLASIQEYGVPGAVDFCHTAALPITDSMSTHFGASIRRVSDRPRNPLNEANTEERAYIEALKAAKAKGEELPALITVGSSKVLAYYAIETNDMCLKCHGSKDTHIQPETMDIIKRRYPKDLAMGYDVDEIRGLFVVEMPR